ncbi:hypothetical protein GCM10010269_21220 [Streptomyces humidus]|uniref:Uncharacterized protein n=1 Tax=Streptomyces humidus TaxID=52259 RepID=A0A918FU10_9ACTN|nr:hypothetical protein GCM10010269_21220 [Streptomyces humidus]
MAEQQHGADGEGARHQGGVQTGRGSTPRPAGASRGGFALIPPAQGGGRQAPGEPARFDDKDSERECEQPHDRLLQEDAAAGEQRDQAVDGVQRLAAAVLVRTGAASSDMALLG